MDLKLELNDREFDEHGIVNLVCREYFGQPVTLDGLVSSFTDSFLNPLNPASPLEGAGKAMTNLSECTGCSQYSPAAESFNPANGLAEFLIWTDRQSKRIVKLGALHHKKQPVQESEKQSVKVCCQSRNSQTISCRYTILTEFLLIAKLNSLIIMAISEFSWAIHDRFISFPSCADIISCKNCLANQESGERRPDCSMWLQLRFECYSGGHVFMSHRCIKKLFNFICCVVFSIDKC